MDVLILISAILLTRVSDATDICAPSGCSLQSPGIQPPFRIQGIHPHPCGAPGFSLFCRDNKTMIRFQGHRDLFVKSISYSKRWLDLVDPKNCVPQLFLNLELSLTPFKYFFVAHQYTYINCSDSLGSPFIQVPCMSGSGHHVYVVEPSSSLPMSCSIVNTVAIPFAYSPYLSDSSFGLRFTWDPINISRGEAKCLKTWYPSKYFTGTSASVIVIIAVLFCAMIFLKGIEGGAIKWRLLPNY